MAFRYAMIDGDGAASKLLSFDLEPDPRDLPTGAFLLTEDQFQDWRANPQTRRYDWQARALVACEAPVDLTPYDVPKLLMMDRIIATGKLRLVRGMLKMGQPDDALTDQELALRDRFEAARAFSSGDAQVRGLIQLAGMDPAVILAKPPPTA